MVIDAAQQKANEICINKILLDLTFLNII